jgi:homocysteine S-methyltransferase
LVAASVGPYGAFLADGSEFRGDYGLDEQELEDFHRARWTILAASGADLLACETLPSRLEARVLRRLLEETPGVQAWFSFGCRDGRSLNDGSPIDEVAAELDDCPQVVAVGVNCTAPQHLSSLLERVRLGTSKPAVVYPNSGELWDADNRNWQARAAGGPSWLVGCDDWVRRGARLIGGCCRTSPGDIEQLRRCLVG